MEPGSVTKLLQELGWETLQARRKHKRITTLYKMEHNIIDIPVDQYIIHNTRCLRKHNSQFLQIRHSSNTFGKSFFPTTAKEWNALPLSSSFFFFPLSGVRCCLQLFHRLICYSSPPSSVSCLLLPVSLLSGLLHISLYTVLPSQSWPPSSPPALLS